MATGPTRSCSIVVRVTWAPQDGYVWSDQFVTTGTEHRRAVGRDAIIQLFSELLDEMIAGRAEPDGP